MNYQDCLKKFIIHCASINLQKSTIESYQSKLKLFSNYLANKENKDINTLEISAVTADDVEMFLNNQSRRVGKTTIRHYYNTLNIFFGFIHKRKITDENIMDMVTKPRVGERVIRVFNNKEINILLSSFDKTTFVGYRNYFIMATLFSTGMRISELCNIKCNDVMLDFDLISVIGKRDKERNIPISPVLKKILKKYFVERAMYIKESGLTNSHYFFITRTGNQMKRDNVEQIFLKIKESYNITGNRFSAHTFRNTFAKTYLLNGGDVFTLQKILGHSKIATTQRYIVLKDEDIKAQNEKYNPLDNTRWEYY